MTTEAATPKKSPGFWRLAWRRYRRQKLGMFGLFVILCLFIVGFCAPLLANDDPIVCKYEGEIYFPAIVETVQNIPFASRVIHKDKPFRFVSFVFKESYDSERGDWAILPPVPFGPIELAGDRLAKPAGVHWLGTDASGRDVLAWLSQ